LVGVDGSHESEVALQRAAEILGTRIGRLTLASVTEFDYGSPQAEEDGARARETLRRAAASTDVPEPGTSCSRVGQQTHCRSTRNETAMSSLLWAVEAGEPARLS
jgi:hypothetical protein